MEPILIATLFGLIALTLLINIYILNENMKWEKTFKKFGDDIPSIVEAFTSLKDTVNNNVDYYNTFIKKTNAHSEIIARMFNILEIHAMALKLTKPDPSLLEDPNDQTV